MNIYGPEFELKNTQINFPVITDCDSTAETFLVIKNNGKEDLTIEKQLQNSNLFIINKLPVKIQSDKSDTIHLRIQENRMGQLRFWDTLVIKECNIHIPVEFIVEKQDYSFSTSKDTIKFGDIIKCGDLKISDKFIIEIEKHITSDVKLIQIVKPDNCFLNIEEGDILLDFNEIKIDLDLKNEGSFHNNIQLILHPCNKLIDLVLTGNVIIPKLSVEPKELSFSITDEFSETSKNIKVFNKGECDIVISSFENISPPFFVNNSLFPFTLKPKEFKDIYISYIPGSSSVDTNVIYCISTLPCELSEEITLTGKSTFEIIKRISMYSNENKLVKPGDSVEVPYCIKSVSDLPLHNLGIQSLEFDLLYNPSTLFPSDVIISQNLKNNKNLIKFEWKLKDRGKINIFAEFENPEKILDTELFIFKGQTYLGNNSITFLSLDSFKINSKIKIEVESDPVKIEFYGCLIDSRLIQKIENEFLSIANSLIYVNAFEIEYYVLSKLDEVKIDIFDLNGKKTNIIQNLPEKLGINRLLINTENLGNGAYLIKYEHSNNIAIKKILIMN